MYNLTGNLEIPESLFYTILCYRVTLPDFKKDLKKAYKLVAKGEINAPSKVFIEYISKFKFASIERITELCNKYDSNKDGMISLE